MANKVTCEFDRICRHGLVNDKEVLWEDMARCLIYSGSLKILFQTTEMAATRFPWIEGMSIPAHETLEVLSNSFFPKWMVTAKDVETLKDPRLLPESFGPPADTTWVPRCDPVNNPYVDLWSSSPLDRLGKVASTSSQVGLFREGVAFELVRGPVEILPWKFIQLKRDRLRGQLIAYIGRSTRDSPGIDDSYEIDRDQVRAIFKYPSGRTWDNPVSKQGV